MELGVDISELNTVNLRNGASDSANYAQRSGRLGEVDSCSSFFVLFDWQLP